MKHTRRQLLTAGSLAAAGLLAGCIGGRGGEGGGGTDDGSAAGDGGDPTTDGPTATRTTNPDALTLSTLDVGGSPGDDVVVKPSGTVALLDFFATWCAPCKPQMKHLRSIHERFPGVHLVSITSERDREAIRSFWREYEGTWPVAQDPELRATTKYNAGQLPTMLVLDADGNEVWRHVGLAAEDTIAEQLETAGASPSA